MSVIFHYQGVRYVAAGRPAPKSFLAPVTCRTCGRTWDDGRVSGLTPAPAGRCPFDAEPEPGTPQPSSDDYAFADFSDDYAHADFAAAVRRITPDLDTHDCAVLRSDLLRLYGLARR
jgi:hypothetical protein